MSCTVFMYIYMCVCVYHNVHTCTSKASWADIAMRPCRSESWTHSIIICNDWSARGKGERERVKEREREKKRTGR